MMEQTVCIMSCCCSPWLTWFVLDLWARPNPTAPCARSAMARALAAPPRRRAPALLPLFRITLRYLWSPSSDNDPVAAAATNTSTASNTRPQKKKLHRLASVIDAVNERKLPPELRDRANAIRSETDIVNVVEQRIWRSMEEGHFENLPGKGKPLDLSTNPHADPAENTLYRILSKNGCAPEWVELNKEIRSRITEWRSALKKNWANRTDHDNSKWLEGSEALQVQMNEINRKVLRYNLIVPFGRQMFGLKWEKELAKLEE